VNAEDDIGVTPLGLAEENDHSEIAELLRKHGATVSVGMENTPLHQAVTADDTIKVQSLIAKGANVNAKNRLGLTPLHLVASSGLTALVKLLIAKGADVNVKDSQGRSPLDWAKDKGHTEIVELLRKHGAKE